MKQKEIKFRRKTKKQYGGDWEYATMDEYGHIFWNFASNSIDKKTLTRFTGLSDKNNKEIYGEDIIEIKVEVPNKDTEEGLLLLDIMGERGLSSLKAKREFYNGKWKVEDLGYTFILHSLEDKKIGKNLFHKDTVYGDLGKTTQQEIEVIGNIYKNKDLLK